MNTFKPKVLDDYIIYFGVVLRVKLAFGYTGDTSGSELDVKVVQVHNSVAFSPK